MREGQASHRPANRLCFSERFSAMTAFGHGFDLPQLHLDPYLTDVKSSFFSAKKPVLEQSCRSSKISCFRFVQGKFVYQRNRHTLPIGIALENPHTFHRPFAQDGHGSRCTRIVHRVPGVVIDSFLENGQCFGRVACFV